MCRTGKGLERNSAFRALWERHHEAGSRAARRIAPRLDGDDIVSTAYLQIYSALINGKGPRGAFRPYLYQVIRGVAADSYRPQEEASDDFDTLAFEHRDAPWEDETFDTGAASRAFASLPERWRSALWYTVVEQLPPREVAPIIGIPANAVSALVLRAQKGLRDAWIEQHLSVSQPTPQCAYSIERMQKLHRGKLTAKVKREVEAHISTCLSCSSAFADVKALNLQLAPALAAIFVGGAATSLLTEFGHPPQAPSMAAQQPAAHGSASPATSISGATGSAGGTTLPATVAAGSLTGALGASKLLAGAAALAIISLTGAAVFSHLAGEDEAEAVTTEQIDAYTHPAVRPSESDGDRSTEGVILGHVQHDADSEGREGPSSTSAPEDRSNPSDANDDGDAAADGSAYGDANAGSDSDASSDAGARSDADAAAGAGSGSTADATSEGGADAGVSAGTDSGADTSIDPTTGVDPEPPSDGLEDPTLLLGYACVVDNGEPGTVQPSGYASEYGAIQATLTKLSTGSSALLVPPGNETVDDGRGNVFQNIYSGTDPTSPFWWWGRSITPLSQWGGEFENTELTDVVLELRLVAPDGRYSPWTHVDLADVTCE